MPEQFATAAATKSFFDRHSTHAKKQRKLGDLNVSAIANGSYLGDSDNSTDRNYEEAFVQAGLSGVNFFDTALNYRCQRSERNLAFAIRKLAAHGIFRDQLVVSTKGGFLPADGTPEGYQEYILKCFLNTGLIKPDDIVANCHCMTPAFLSTVIDMSLNNLKLKSIDLYYLHNPEIQLQTVSSSVFYENLTKAFALFEEKVSDGKIKSYGLATWNGFRQGLGARDLLNLETVLKCAKTAGGDNHHFKAIQLPYNLAMLEAVAIQNQKTGDDTLPIIAAAAHHGLSVLISAPLMQSHTLKINPKFFTIIPGEGTAAQKSLEFVISSPGVVAAMVGMKTVPHVEENTKVLHTSGLAVTDLQQIVTHLVKS